MPDSDQTPQTPVPETMAGAVFPYRGNEQHGVAVHGVPDLVDAYDMGDPVEPGPEPDEPEPIPVRIVRSGGRELVKFRTERAFAGDNASRIVGQNETRNTVKVKNIGPDAGDRVWVAEQPHLANSTFGYPLDPGQEFVTAAETPVYASRAETTATNPVPLAVFVEHVVQVH